MTAGVPDSDSGTEAEQPATDEVREIVPPTIFDAHRIEAGTTGRVSEGTGQSAAQVAATGAMSYHAARTKRGLMIGSQGLAAIGTIVVGVIAIRGEMVSSRGVAAALVTLAAVLVAVRTGARTSRVSLDDGLLVIVQGDNRHRFDLTSDTISIQEVGSPGDPDWRLLVGRRGSSPVEITSRLVDPEPFTEAVRHWRPSL